MSLTKQIAKQKQLICREEKLLMLEKLKKRRADTRRKIELGGLVIKSGMDCYNKAIILGAMDYIMQLIAQERSYEIFFNEKGKYLFNLG